MITSKERSYIATMDCLYMDEDHVNFIIEYAPKGTLTELMNVYKKLDVQTVRNIAGEIIVGLESLHSQQIIHTDLKADNVLFDEQFHVKICDFGDAII